MTTLANHPVTLDVITNIPPGMMAIWATATPPSGWLLCAGQAITRTTYANLFTAIGTTYGAGDGSTTFNLPDLRGRVAVGDHLMNGAEPSPARLTTNKSRGQSAGLESISLTISEMPTHQHSGATAGMNRNDPHTHNWIYTGTSVAYSGTGGTYFLNYPDSFAPNGSSQTDINHTHNITGSGGGLPHNNRQPYIALSQIIKT